MIKHSTAKDTKDVSLTIYNGGFGAVKEIRSVSLSGTETELVFNDVAQQIETDSLLVEGLNVLEFNYDYDLISRDKLLKRCVGDRVDLMDRKTGEKKRCRLLSVDEAGRCVLRDCDSSDVYIDPQGELILPYLPTGFIEKPALVWKIAPTKADSIKVSYLSQGFRWSSNYVMELLEDTLNIAGWAEIENQSGTTFQNARVKLIAGDVNRIKGDAALRFKDEQVCYNSAGDAQAEEKSFFDYHMYTLFSPTTLKDNQTKQVNILNGCHVPYKKYYRFTRSKDSADIIVEFANRKECGLGIPMPKGKIKLYKADEADNSLEFIGEDSIEHTPKDEVIRLNAGKAFDIILECNEVDWKKIKGFEHYKYECIIKNHKKEAAEVHFEHYLWGAWEMVSTTHKFVKKTSEAIEFTLDMPADSETRVCFEYEIDERSEITLEM